MVALQAAPTVKVLAWYMDWVTCTWLIAPFHYRLGDLTNKVLQTWLYVDAEIASLRVCLCKTGVVFLGVCEDCMREGKDYIRYRLWFWGVLIIYWIAFFQIGTLSFFFNQLSKIKVRSLKARLQLSRKFKYASNKLFLRFVLLTILMNNTGNFSRQL